MPLLTEAILLPVLVLPLIIVLIAIAAYIEHRSI
jgi:hypothetical protein